MHSIIRIEHADSLHRFPARRSPCRGAAILCSQVGSKERHEYTIMGDAVNLSARLMGEATKSDGETPILADIATYRQSEVNIVPKDATIAVEYKALPPVRLKGKAEPTPLYRPMKMIYKKAEQKMVQNEGRTQELAQLRKMFAMMATCATAGP